MFNLDCEKETNRITKKIQQIFSAKDRKKAIVGISGGIDSAVVASLCVKVLGKENVIGLMLPYGEQIDIKDSELMIKHLNISSHTINIESIVNSIPIAINNGRTVIKGSEKDRKIRLGNVMARIRMIILFDASYYFKGLVMGTGNRTELMLGYFTMYGDGACAVEPIGHLYKTEVRLLAEYLGIPKKIITKAPTAGLWGGQTDEKELGYKYEDIDKFLHLSYDKKLPYDKLSCLPYGYTEKFMNYITDKILKNEFKSESSIIFKRHEN